MYRIGVDVGGTNTDAVILNVDQSTADTPSRGVLATSKTPTTRDVTSGILTAVDNVLKKADIATEKILSVAIGTTHFVNAVVEADARRLSKVAVVRLCNPFTRQLPPFTNFPPSLKSIISGPVFYLDGGLEIDGREITSLNAEQIKNAVASIRQAGVSKVALVGIFSPLDHQGIHEDTCKAMMLEEDPSLSIVCSHSIGGVGLLERENATILNASILDLARKTVSAFCRAMVELRLSCPLYLTQNDGTLTDAVTAAELPIQTFSSGPTNSMTGAAFLASLDRPGAIDSSGRQVLVADIGGTTLDVCALLPSGFPRQAPNFVEIAGVRTAFSMPDVLSLGLGGGSIVRYDKTTGRTTVGPDSVGHLLTEKAISFGGEVMTATDIAVAIGSCQIGDPSKAKGIASEVLSGARNAIGKILERAVEGMKVSSLPVTVLLVGGGSIIHMDSLKSVSDCIIPPHHDSANAVGAAIAKVAGTVDVIEILDNQDERTVLKRAEQSAIEAAVNRGADRDSVKIAEVEKLPLQYVTNKATRIKVKAIGNLRHSFEGEAQREWPKSFLSGDADAEEEEKVAGLEVAAKSDTKHSIYLDIPAYKPDVRNGIWYISPVDLEFIASGTGVLGTGGGGSPYLQYLIDLQVLKEAGTEKMRVVSPTTLDDTAVCVETGWYGAPSAGIERLPSGTEMGQAVEGALKINGLTKLDAVYAGEIGGANGLASFPTAVHFDVPVLDGDLMGRAYPSIEHGTPYVYGHSPTPCALADAKGNQAAVMGGESHSKVEKMLRSLCIELGLFFAMSTAPLSGQVIKKYIVPNTVSQSWYIGRAIHQARRTKADTIDEILKLTPGKLLYTGKIIDVGRSVRGGYDMGYCVLAPLSDDELDQQPTATASAAIAQASGRPLLIPFQNEFLFAAYIADPKNPEDPSGQEVICTVPDLISILGQDGEAIGSQELRYGLRVHVLGMSAHPLWTGDARALRVGGPQGFGLDMEWTSIGEYQKPRSVIDDFNVSTHTE